MYKIIGADGKEYGPIGGDQLRQWINEGRANAQTQVLAEGATEWKPLSTFPEFFPAPASLPGLMVVPGPIQVVQAPQTNPMAVTGMVLGIVSLMFGWCCCYVGVPLGVGGIICSAVALSQINKDPQHQLGKGMAIAGLVLSIFAVLLTALFFALGLALSKSDLLRKLQEL